MIRRLQIRWMVVGPGGYDEKRVEVPFPSFLTVLAVLLLLVSAWQLWEVLYRGH